MIPPPPPFQPLIANKTMVGVFFGDEICCGGVPLANLTTVVSRTRAVLGPDAILYTNECHELASWDAVPADLDLISIDAYAGYLPGTKGTAEVALVRTFYETVLYPKMQPHQQAMLVPGYFACSNLTFYPLDQQAQQIVAKVILVGGHQIVKVSN